jgi:hypothetical protein
MDHNVSFPDAEKIKGHFRKNKERYLFFGLGAVVVLAIRKPIVIAPVFNNHNIPVFSNTNTQFGGHAYKIVKNLETGEIWETVTEAARAVDAPLSLMSRHLNGHKPNVYGKHFEIVGLGTRS